jgi:putative transposase
MVYIDLNMVRAGVVDHPSKWRFCGYNELMKNPQRYRLINIKKVMELTGVDNPTAFRNLYSQHIESALNLGNMERESKWTESIAVGTEAFVGHVHKQLGYRAKYRNMLKIQKSWILKNGFS